MEKDILNGNGLHQEEIDIDADKPDKPQNVNIKLNNFMTSLLDWNPKCFTFLRSFLIRTLFPFLVWSTIIAIRITISTGSDKNNSDVRSSINGICSILFFGLGLGELLEWKFRLPPLLGMLITGMVLRNVEYFSGTMMDVSGIGSGTSSLFRQLALVIILIRAGLGLDPEALFRLKGVVLRLAFLPCLAEAFTVAAASHWILGFPFLWGLILGFVLAAVSPAVVVPCLLTLRESGYGVSKGIPTILIAASSVDDILAISGFGLVLSLIFSSQTASWTQHLFQGPLELGTGLGIGIGWGLILGVVFGQKDKKGSYSGLLFRFLFLFLGSITAILALPRLHLPGSGPLAILTATFVAAIFWRRKGVLGDTSSLNQIFSILWTTFQPLLFGLIGAEINLKSLEISVVTLALVVILIGLTIRILVTYLTVFGARLNVKERIFVAIAWIPKATVQAAIGAIALDTARTWEDPIQEELGLKVLTIAVLVILITAPIGAIGVTLLGPILLSSSSTDDKNDQKTEQNDEPPKNEAINDDAINIDAISINANSIFIELSSVNVNENQPGIKSNAV